MISATTSAAGGLELFGLRVEDLVVILFASSLRHFQQLPGCGKVPISREEEQF
jgi:hypothetical protein